MLSRSTSLSEARPRVAIVDYGMGNLFSVASACARAGLDAVITSAPADVAAADAVILPGVGAFGDAMHTLRRLGLASALKDVADAGTPLIGICLGMQLLMTESFEFGRHEGLGIVPGTVEPLTSDNTDGKLLKVPQVGWNRMMRPADAGDAWCGTPLDGLHDGVFMYFVHSFYVRPADPTVSIAVTTYGHTTFCSALRRRNIFACQGHPERSGRHGLAVYENIAQSLKEPKETR